MALATAGGLEVPAEKEEPRVSARRSVFADHLVCMECGLSFKMIKRHLGNDHAMTPDSYRAKWGLPRDYPMVAAEYSALRAEVARATGLGRRRAPPMAEPAVVHLLERTRVRPGTAD